MQSAELLRDHILLYIMQTKYRNEKIEEHQQYNVTLRKTLTQELKIFRSILDYVKNISDTFSDNKGKYYVFRGEKEELPRMTPEDTFLLYIMRFLEQRVKAFGSDLTNIVFAHNKIQHRYKVLNDQTSSFTEHRRNFPLYDSLTSDIDKILSQVKS